MKLLGLIGNPVAHSRSPQIFARFFQSELLTDWEYQLFPLENIDALSELIAQNLQLIGFNVTIPYKQQIIPHLHILSPEARFAGAVNTVLVVRKTDRIYLTGHNTDVFGFEKSLGNTNFKTHSNALILGTGGASKAVQYVLQQHKIPFQLVSRKMGNNQISYADLNQQVMEQHTFIINTTPLGMEPDTESFPPIPYEFLTPFHYCYDLVYKPEKTQFLALAEEKGASIQNGMQMLQFQAEKAWELFKLNAQNS